MSSEKKVAFITGSGKKRIGYYLAVEAARRGYHVAVHYHSSNEEAAETVTELESYGVQAEAFQADLRVEAEVVQMCEKVLARFQKVDLLATCAAVWEPKPLFETTAEDMQRQFAINTVGTFVCCREIGKAMVSQEEGGSIVLFGDWAVARPYRGYLAYFSAKGSLPVLTVALANELAAHNPKVRVNCIHPGPAMVPDNVGAEERQKIRQRMLCGDLGRPEHVVDGVFFFAENDFTTGVCLPIDGGRTAWTP